jgi:hypothetical protein
MFALAGVNRYISAGYDFQKLNLAVPAFSEAPIDVMCCAIVVCAISCRYEIFGGFASIERLQMLLLGACA